MINNDMKQALTKDHLKYVLESFRADFVNNFRFRVRMRTVADLVRFENVQKFEKFS